MKKYIVFVIVLFLAVALACQRPPAPIPGELEMVKLTDLKNIPLNYGKLVSVTTQTGFRGWFYLWFENDQGVIRMVRVSVIDKRIVDDILTIHRN